ncbi:MAG TPA: hypothetical protein VND93_15320 [Myxococcales bacterium]|jgi:hypothetical protein|nr:hypothetical protein [Myxococcales bacterium]
MELVRPDPEVLIPVEQSRHRTAGKAALLLVERKGGFHIPTAKEKRNLLVAFAERNLVVYGKAFDVVRLSRPVDLSRIEQIRTYLDAITVYEIKSTNRKLPPDFKGYFFALTGAEMLVAQSLKKRFRFAFVNTVTGTVLDLSLNELLKRTRGIYPTWSICF